jgi:hypothetical protein
MATSPQKRQADGFGGKLERERSISAPRIAVDSADWSGDWPADYKNSEILLGICARAIQLATDPLTGLCRKGLSGRSAEPTSEHLLKRPNALGEVVAVTAHTQVLAQRPSFAKLQPAIERFGHQLGDFSAVQHQGSANGLPHRHNAWLTRREETS